ncbi:MAG TPA: class I adenylate-forming enzyme family protein, partial [Nannocystis sp.]
MRRGAQYWPDNLAVVDVHRGDAGRFTYAELNRRADALAGWLRARGVVRGDRVAILAHNGVEILDVFFACAKLGAIFVPLNWRCHVRELAAMFAPLAVKVLVFGPEFAGAVAELRPHCPAPQLVHLDGDPVDRSAAWP